MTLMEQYYEALRINIRVGNPEVKKCNPASPVDKGKGDDIDGAVLRSPKN
ncbi:hypothetical protein L798_02416 [Zootermopsis nevadensis]|uniref:Uncharacterized protein n=1 Tax=Zootermopsis nevadensis TaxID=136037 RepID=A0A067RRW6_ZOONE|nr:hypothetical protein L798_02416 [Zootermopsis nevadensis]